MVRMELIQQEIDRLRNRFATKSNKADLERLSKKAARSGGLHILCKARRRCPLPTCRARPRLPSL